MDELAPNAPGVWTNEVLDAPGQLENHPLLGQAPPARDRSLLDSIGSWWFGNVNAPAIMGPAGYVVGQELHRFSDTGDFGEYLKNSLDAGARYPYEVGANAKVPVLDNAFSWLRDLFAKLGRWALVGLAVLLLVLILKR